MSGASPLHGGSGAAIPGIVRLRAENDGAQLSIVRRRLH